MHLLSGPVAVSVVLKYRIDVPSQKGLLDSNSDGSVAFISQFVVPSRSQEAIGADGTYVGIGLYILWNSAGREHEEDILGVFYSPGGTISYALVES
jgi:hypothetical protein